MALLEVSADEIEPGYGKVLVRHIGRARVIPGSGTGAEVGVVVKACTTSRYANAAGCFVVYQHGALCPADLEAVNDYDVLAFVSAKSPDLRDAIANT